MKYADELRIMADWGTFTQSDLQADLGCSDSWTSSIFAYLVQAKLIERVRVGHFWLYALSEKGKRAVNSLPVLDEKERCLLTTFQGITPVCCYCGAEMDWHGYYDNTFLCDNNHMMSTLLAEQLGWIDWRLIERD